MLSLQMFFLKKKNIIAQTLAGKKKSNCSKRSCFPWFQSILIRSSCIFCCRLCYWIVLQLISGRVRRYMLCLTLMCGLSLLQVKEAEVTEARIDETPEQQQQEKPASLLYFIMNDLNKKHLMYQFSSKV